MDYILFYSGLFMLGVNGAGILFTYNIRKQLRVAKDIYENLSDYSENLIKSYDSGKEDARIMAILDETNLREQVEALETWPYYDTREDQVSQEDEPVFRSQVLALIDADRPALTVERLAVALCWSQEAHQSLDQVAPTTAAHWRQVAERMVAYFDQGRSREA